MYRHVQRSPRRCGRQNCSQQLRRRTGSDFPRNWTFMVSSRRVSIVIMHLCAIINYYTFTLSHTWAIPVSSFWHFPGDANSCSSWENDLLLLLAKCQRVVVPTYSRTTSLNLSLMIDESSITFFSLETWIYFQPCQGSHNEDNAAGVRSGRGPRQRKSQQGAPGDSNGGRNKEPSPTVPGRKHSIARHVRSVAQHIHCHALPAQEEHHTPGSQTWKCSHHGGEHELSLRPLTVDLRLDDTCLFDL